MKLLSFILCDEVRHEITGKAILIGVYDLGIVVPTNAQWPIKLPLFFFFRFLLEPGDRPCDEIEFKVSLDEKPLVSGKGAIHVKDAYKPITLIDRIPGLEIPKEGKLQFELVVKSKGEVIGSLRPHWDTLVQKLPESTAATSPTPR